jgi:predicted rRNA methylase YqxC with S4 and FtsJ domains
LLLAQEERGIYGKEEWGVHGGDVVLDVGAYIGTWTKHALARGAKVVVAIEPSPQSVECLKRSAIGQCRQNRRQTTYSSVRARALTTLPALSLAPA